MPQFIPQTHKKTDHWDIKMTSSFVTYSTCHRRINLSSAFKVSVEKKLFMQLVTVNYSIHRQRSSPKMSHLLQLWSHTLDINECCG
jgi:hypothetical protein